MLSLPCDGPRDESPRAGPDPGRLAPLSAAGPVITTRDGSQDSLIAHSTAHRNLAAASRHDDCGAKLAEVHALPSSPDTRRRDGLAGLNTARRRSGLAVHASRCGPFRIASGAADRRTRAVCKPSTTSIRRDSSATCESCAWRWDACRGRTGVDTDRRGQPAAAALTHKHDHCDNNGDRSPCSRLSPSSSSSSWP